jgi:hypothetical protein
VKSKNKIEDDIIEEGDELDKQMGVAVVIDEDATTTKEAKKKQVKKYHLDIHTIDVFWLQRQLSKFINKMLNKMQFCRNFFTIFSKNN